MEEQPRVISHRLAYFMEKHAQYWDCGDAENGPQLCADYSGPQWASDAYDEAVYGPGYALAIQNFYAGIDDTVYMTDREIDALAEQCRKENYNA
jgi:hypothetical protein